MIHTTCRNTVQIGARKPEQFILRIIRSFLTFRLSFSSVFLFFPISLYPSLLLHLVLQYKMQGEINLNLAMARHISIPLVLFVPARPPNS
jgi:hypothetical protein